MVFLFTGCLLTGCAVPADPEGTLGNITGGTLRVGFTESITESGEWVRVVPGNDPVGIEPELVRSFAATRGAAVEWRSGSEQDLVSDLKHGDLDLVIGGFAEDTPWSKDAGLTRPFVESTDERGKTVKHVLLVPHGENAFLLELDRHLLGREVTL
ncbi:ABC transporter substrate-binding protein [Arthrobacter sp. ISL-65]|nr:ABC transporter substrate-binding protein [Arthrobacter sp. ISL-65]